MGWSEAPVDNSEGVFEDTVSRGPTEERGLSEEVSVVAGRLPEERELIDQAIEEAVLPALLAALAYCTGDMSMLKEDLRPPAPSMLDPNGGMTPEQLSEGRALARSALEAFLAKERAKEHDSDMPLGPPSEKELEAMLTFVMGSNAPEGMVERYLELFKEELALGGEDLRAPAWKLSEIAPERQITVGIVGAGMSGIAMAHRLGQAGIDYVVFEKNQDVGGTWLDNKYPGCRVDVPNFLYSYSFAQRNDWPQHFSTQPVLLEYFRQVAEQVGIREHVRFGTEVVSARYQEDSGKWLLQVRSRSEGDTKATSEVASGTRGEADQDAKTELIEVDALVTAVGQLNRPHIPDIPGKDSFEGPCFHSARWDTSVDLSGKRVAVIGTGASAVQFVIGIADKVGQMTIFQRTPNWFGPTPDYHENVSPAFQWLLAKVPGYAQWHRFWLFWINTEGLLPFLQVDPSWDDGGRTVSMGNDLLRQFFTAHLEADLSDRPDLLEKVVPQYPPSAKRVIRDNGSWASTLKRPNVALVTEPIDRIEPHGVRVGDGTFHEADVIIWGTGFLASEFLAPMRIVGRNGVELHEFWDGDARAYLGTTVPGFPNLFMIYGPNTNIVVNGSIIFFAECGVHYILECLKLMLTHSAKAVECRKEPFEAYNKEIDEGNAKMAWGAANVHTWYKNAKGRVSQNWPFTLHEFWARTNEVNPEDYELVV
jgi:4-hydroxyacetophenone monooxygenase